MFSTNGPSHSQSEYQNGHSYNPAASSITASMVPKDQLAISLPPDALLSACWSKSCQFARNFGATAISTELLLLGATHVREAEAVLLTAATDLETLNNRLTERCARRSFSPPLPDGKPFHPDKTLRSLLCGAGAMAADVEAPTLSLSLLLDAIALHDPKLPVLDLLPSIKSPHRGPSTQSLLDEIADRIADIEARLTPPPPDYSDTEASGSDPLHADMLALRQQLSQLTDLLLVAPEHSLAGITRPQLAIPTRDQFFAALDDLPRRIAEAVLSNPPSRTKKAWFR